MTVAGGRVGGSDPGDGPEAVGGVDDHLPDHLEAAAEVGHLVPDVETLARRLAAVDYLVDEGLATSMFLSLRLPQPLLLEGEAGVGKTEAGKSLAAVLDTPLIRLQCYEGIDAAEALYEWNYPRQLLSIRLADTRGTELREDDLFGPDYLTARPLLRALQHPGPRPAVLLIDEIDRADDDFEAFLLELLAEATVTIPEIGTIRATHPPIIVLTSNRTRDLHDAVKRRCLYHWIDYPSSAREVDIIRRRVKAASATLAVQVADAVSRMRDGDIQKPPGIAEAIDWLAALHLLGVETLSEAAMDRTLGSVLKYREDQEVIRAAGLAKLMAGVQ
jgi:MoxR-like ATPase